MSAPGVQALSANGISGDKLICEVSQDASGKEKSLPCIRHALARIGGEFPVVAKRCLATSYQVDSDVHEAFTEE